MQFTPTVSPVCLPDYGDQSTFAGQDAVVMGWGALRENGPQPSNLMQVTLQIQTNAACKTNYGNDAPGGIIDTMLCASYPGQDSCSVIYIRV